MSFMVFLTMLCASSGNAKHTILVYYRKYQLTEYDKKLGTKAIRLINGTYHKELSLVSEHFLYELLDGKHRDNVYVMGIFDVGLLPFSQSVS